MHKIKEIEELPYSPETLVKAVSEQHIQSNKRWIWCAVLALIVFISDPEKSVTVLGVPFNDEITFLALAALISIANVAYLVAHTAAYQAHTSLQKIAKEQAWDDIEIVSGVTYSNYIYSMMASNLDRIFPLFQNISHREFQMFLYKTTKTFADFVKVFFAPTAAMYAVANNQTESVFFWPAAGITGISVIFSISFYFRLLDYIFRK